MPSIPKGLELGEWGSKHGRDDSVCCLVFSEATRFWQFSARNVTYSRHFKKDKVGCSAPESLMGLEKAVGWALGMTVSTAKH